MAKTIKITLYNPKELWRMFWNKFFWPRRKVCAEWVDFMQVRLEHAIITDLLIGKYYDGGILGESATESLELDIRKVIEEKCDELKKVIAKPIDE